MVNRVVGDGMSLDRPYGALAHASRRQMVSRLTRCPDGVSVTALGSQVPGTLPAVMKHLDVLSDAGLVTRVKSGRTVTCRLAAGPMEEAMEWLARYQRFWSASLDRLSAFVEED